MSKIGKKQKEFVGTQPKKKTQPGPAAEKSNSKCHEPVDCPLFTIAR